MSEQTTRVQVSEKDGGLYTQTITAGHHVLTADEPKEKGGGNKGPDPYSLLLAALGACTSMTLRMYARHKNWPLESISVHLSHHKETDAAGRKNDVILREIFLTGALDADQKARLLEIANKCPVHKTLENHPIIASHLV